MILKYGNKKIDDSDIRTNDKLSKIGTNWLNRYELTECSRIESNPYATGFVQYSIKWFNFFNIYLRYYKIIF